MPEISEPHSDPILAEFLELQNGIARFFALCLEEDLACSHFLYASEAFNMAIAVLADTLSQHLEDENGSEFELVAVTVPLDGFLEKERKAREN